MGRLVISTVVALALCVSAASARDMKDEIEFSLAGSIEAHVMQGETIHLLNVPLRAGYFVHDWVELEAEGIFSVIDEKLLRTDPNVKAESDFAVTLSGLVSVSVPTETDWLPFVTAGYGVSNAHSQLNVQMDAFENVTLGVLNFGGGVKHFFGDNAALRVDYRFQKFVGGPDKNDAKYEKKFDCSAHSLFFGVSLLPF
ncbi:MAG TPA: outer membrane beta-barrel protein [candidate division Zixibacteria bacterium]|nr:outer membrane beta-barrel protein [candidate division Zixibacteria bacterium]